MKPELNTILSRLFASLIVPGFIASGPYLILLQNDSSKVHQWLFSGGFGATSVLVFIVFTAGLLVEEAGDRLEWGFWKIWKIGESKEEEDKRKGEWLRYLVVNGVSETMMEHIAHVVSRLKWELSGGIAFIVGALPTILLLRSQPSFHIPSVNLWLSWWVVLVFQLVMGILLIVCGRFTMSYLVKLRHSLLNPDENVEAIGQKASPGGQHVLGQVTCEVLTVEVTPKT